MSKWIQSLIIREKSAYHAPASHGLLLHYIYWRTRTRVLMTFRNIRIISAKLQIGIGQNSLSQEQKKKTSIGTTNKSLGMQNSLSQEQKKTSVGTTNKSLGMKSIIPIDPRSKWPEDLLWSRQISGNKAATGLYCQWIPRRKASMIQWIEFQIQFHCVRLRTHDLSGSRPLTGGWGYSVMPMAHICHQCISSNSAIPQNISIVCHRHRHSFTNCNMIFWYILLRSDISDSIVARIYDPWEFRDKNWHWI